MPSYPQNIEELDQLISQPSEAVLEMAASAGLGRVAVLGAGGKMGFHLCLMLQRAFAAAGRRDAVTAVSRFGNSEVVTKFERHGIRVIRADLCIPEQLRALPEFDSVFFMAGVKFGTNDQPELLRQVNAELPKAVCERYKDAAFVALSSGCVYSFSAIESGGSTEESPTNPPGAYAQSCLDRERAFKAAAEEFGTRSTLIRLNYSIDLRYGVLHDVAREVLGGGAIDVSTGYVNVIWQGDAVAHSILSLPLASAPPFVLNVTGTDILAVREIAGQFASEFECEVSFDGIEQRTHWLNDASRAHQLFWKAASFRRRDGSLDGKVDSLRKSIARETNGLQDSRRPLLGFGLPGRPHSVLDVVGGGTRQIRALVENRICGRRWSGAWVSGVL